MNVPLQDSLDQLLNERPISVEQIISEMAKASRLANQSDIQAIMGVAKLNDMFDQTIAYPAMSLLPAWGRVGIQHLCEMALNGPNSVCALTILTVVSLGRTPTSQDTVFLGESWDTLDKYSLDQDLSLFAARSLREVVLEQLTDPYKTGDLFNAIWQQTMFPPDNVAQEERLNFLLDILVDTRMVLNKEILENFDTLLEKPPSREEEIHRFLVEHPVLLDPFLVQLRTKHELGDDFITDFVVRRSNDEYLVVEIENSTDKLFNQDGTLSHSLVVAISQVRDFQAWITDNIAYARTKLPFIRHPEGLVVIGRRADLSPLMEKRLSEENHSRRGQIKVVTYDDLLSQAKSVYRNAIERPIVLKSRDQKSI